MKLETSISNPRGRELVGEGRSGSFVASTCSSHRGDPGKGKNLHTGEVAMTERKENTYAPDAAYSCSRQFELKKREKNNVFGGGKPDVSP